MRRVWVEIAKAFRDALASAGHPPCGGCGLKYRDAEIVHHGKIVTLLAEGVG